MVSSFLSGYKIRSSRIKFRTESLQIIEAMD
jgi:hypothetical protein